MKNDGLVLSALRINASLVAAGTLATAIFAKELDPFRSPFLVPDLVLSAWLIVAAILPRTLAVPGLLSGFGIAVGILGAATMFQLASGDAGPGLVSGLMGASLGLIASLWLGVKGSLPRAYLSF